jgi:hypothetical protein
MVTTLFHRCGIKLPIHSLQWHKRTSDCHTLTSYEHIPCEKQQHSSKNSNSACKAAHATLSKSLSDVDLQIRRGCAPDKLRAITYCQVHNWTFDELVLLPAQCTHVPCSLTHCTAMSTT